MKRKGNLWGNLFILGCIYINYKKEVDELTRDTGKRGMAANSNFHKMIRKQQTMTEEEVLEVLKEKQRRIAEKMGWNDNWHKK